MSQEEVIAKSVIDAMQQILVKASTDSWESMVVAFAAVSACLMICAMVYWDKRKASEREDRMANRVTTLEDELSEGNIGREQKMITAIESSASLLQRSTAVIEQNGKILMAMHQERSLIGRFIELWANRPCVAMRGNVGDLLSAVEVTKCVAEEEATPSAAA